MCQAVRSEPGLAFTAHPAFSLAKVACLCPVNPRQWQACLSTLIKRRRARKDRTSLVRFQCPSRGVIVSAHQCCRPSIDATSSICLLRSSWLVERTAFILPVLNSRLFETPSLLEKVAAGLMSRTCPGGAGLPSPFLCTCLLLCLRSGIWLRSHSLGNRN